MKDFQYLARIRHKITVILFFICLTTMFLAIPSSVFAHKVSIFAWVEGDVVHTQSIFFGGKKIQNGTIEVFDASGKQMIQGKTDDNGEFLFKTPVKAAMKIVVSAGMGHQAVWNLKTSDFESMGHDTPHTEPVSSQGHSPDFHEEIPSPPNAPPSIDPDEIRDIVEKALDKKLAPVLKMLSESRSQAPSISDILGGIGYIIGLVGLAAYISSRKKKDNFSK